MTATALPILHRRFAAEGRYLTAKQAGYTLLPLRFSRLDVRRYVVTNLAGERLVVTGEALRRFLHHELQVDDPHYADLESRHFLMPAGSTVALDLLATKYRTKQSVLASFTSLFMFVTTLRCDHSCPYCQVSRQSQDKSAFDMTPAMADRAIDFMFCSSTTALKVEFQGGESLLNFGLISYIVEQVTRRNETENRNIQFVIATNLAPSKTIIWLSAEDIGFSCPPRSTAPAPCTTLTGRGRAVTATSGRSTASGAPVRCSATMPSQHS